MRYGALITSLRSLRGAPHISTVAPTLAHMGYELVRVQISGKERPVVQIMADRADEAPFRVEDCEAISHALGAVLALGSEDRYPSRWGASGS